MIAALVVAALGAPPFEGTFTFDGRDAPYALWVPDRPHGLLVWFHEDGGERTWKRRARGWLRRLADAHDLALLVPQEPDAGYWWAPAAARNSAWVGALLAGVDPSFDPERVVFAGMSGGAGFAAGLPAALGWRYHGGVVSACGADIPRDDGVNTVDDPPPLAGVDAPPGARVHAWFVVGASDELRGLSEAAAAWYTGQGVGRVDHRITPRPGHCAFNLRAQVQEGVASVLAP